MPPVGGEATPRDAGTLSDVTAVVDASVSGQTPTVDLDASTRDIIDADADAAPPLSVPD
jgi:hypothetical protein